MYQFSYFSNGITQTVPDKVIETNAFIDICRNDLRIRELIESIRSNPSNKDTLKRNLPYVTFSGIFSTRRTDSLTEHSGLICLDFDNLENPTQFLNDVCSDPFIYIAFKSPSGNGAKLVIKIEPLNHLQSFHELSQYFQEKYHHEPDRSGKDITRACFLSYDPKIYLNENSYVFNVVTQEKTITSTIIKEHFDGENKPPLSPDHNSKYLPKTIELVDLICATQIDITSQYDDWTKIAFALSTLGEAGRELFHKVSQFHPNYKFDDCDDKYTEASTNRKRIRTPKAFFDIAGDYGIKTKEEQESEKKNSPKPYVTDDEEDELLKYGIYEKYGVYRAISTKGNTHVISNFVMEILYHVQTGRDEAYRLVLIKNIHGREAVINMNTDDFVSLSSFRKLIARFGNFIFSGKEEDLIRLQNKLQREEKSTDIIDVLGYNPNNNFFAFANGLVDTSIDQLNYAPTFYPIDSYGIVRFQDSNYFIPALSKIYIQKEDLFYNDRKFIYKPSDITLSEWYDCFSSVYGANAPIGFLFYVCSLFSHHIFKCMSRRFPILNLYGLRGSGKGTFAESLLALFGDPQEQIMLGGSTTAVGFIRSFAQFRNALVWLDEYKNSLPAKVIESIKNIYDRIGYKRGKKDHTFDTDYVPVQSSCILSGQEMPTIEPALFTRVIMLTFKETQHDNSKRQVFRKLKNMESEGLSHLSVYLLKYAPYIEENFKTVYEDSITFISQALNNNSIEERMISNYGILLAMATILLEYEDLSIDLNHFKTQLIDNLLSQHYILVGSDDVSKFWQTIESLFTQDLIKENRDFMLQDGILYIRLQNVIGLYQKELRQRNDPNYLQKSTLENYIQINQKQFISRSKKMFPDGSYTWAFAFQYSELDINLIRFQPNTPLFEQINKYRDMKIDVPEELNNLQTDLDTSEITF